MVQIGYNVEKEPRGAVLTHRPSKPLKECTPMGASRIEWRRVEDPHGPPSFFDDRYGYAIFAAKGARGWEVCWAGPDEGYTMLEYFESLAKAKNHAEYCVEKEFSRRG